MSKLKSILDLSSDETAIIEFCEPSRMGSIRLQEMGLVSGNYIRLVKKAPFNGPIEIKLKGFNLSLRRDLAEKVKIRKTNK